MDFLRQKRSGFIKWLSDKKGYNIIYRIGLQVYG